MAVAVLLPRTSRTRRRAEVIRATPDGVAAATAFVPCAGAQRRGCHTGSRGGPARGGMARRVIAVSLVWLVLSNGAAVTGFALAVHRGGWEPNWGLLLYLLVQCQINVPLIRDLAAELHPTAGPVRSRLRAALRSRSGMLPRRWPETVAASAVLLLTGLLASGWVDPMLPWLS
ncbi:hypothetical protein SAVIM40S_00289 [Streptomyces avidinii]